jgi:hypothetical protein
VLLHFVLGGAVQAGHVLVLDGDLVGDVVALVLGVVQRQVAVVEELVDVVSHLLVVQVVVLQDHALAREPLALVVLKVLACAVFLRTVRQDVLSRFSCLALWVT